jgi:tetratricopeptide (TPR) repeat protein
VGRVHKARAGAVDRITARIRPDASPDEIRELFRLSKRGPNVQLAALVEGCRLLLDRGELDAARAEADEILAFRGAHRTNHNVTLNALHMAATAYERCGEFRLAIPVREEMVVLARAKRGADGRQTLNVVSLLATDLLKEGDTSRAVELQRLALGQWRSTTGAASAEAIDSEERLGIALVANRDLDEARQTLERVVQARGASGPKARNARSWLAMTLIRQGDLEGGLALQEETLAITRRTFGADDRRTLRDSDHVAETAWRLGQRDRARAMLEGTLATRARVFGDEDPDTQKARKRLSSLLGDP